MDRPGHREHEGATPGAQVPDPGRRAKAVSAVLHGARAGAPSAPWPEVTIHHQEVLRGQALPMPSYLKPTITYASIPPIEAAKEIDVSETNCLPECDTNAFDETSNNLLGAHRRAQHNIAIELEVLGDRIEQHQTAIMIIERRRAYLLAQANEDVPMAQDQNASAPPYAPR